MNVRACFYHLHAPCYLYSQSHRTALSYALLCPSAPSGDYSAAGWAGGAPNGGGNICNNNTVTILEALKLSFGHVTFSVGTGITADHGPYWTVVQRHSYSVGKAFAPTSSPSPYKPDSATPAVVPEGSQGLKASYYPNTNLSGSPVLVRQDFAANFHYFGLGPDPTRMRGGTFSVRWEGHITPLTTVEGGQFNVLLCHGHSCGAPAGLGAQLLVDGRLVVDAWGSSVGEGETTRSTVSPPLNFTRGQSMAVELRYWQANTSGSPSVALQWSLLPAEAAANDTIQAAASLVGDADAIVLCLGGANNDGDATTEGEGVDRSSLQLPGSQLALLQAMWTAAKAHHVKMVTVIVDGKPTAEPFLTTLPAVVAAFQGGQAQGVGVGDVITGRYNPAGKLPVTFPVSAKVRLQYS